MVSPLLPDCVDAAVEGGEDAETLLISGDYSAHASLYGKLKRLHHIAKLSQLWTPTVAARFGGIREDRRVAVPRFRSEVADLCVSSATSLSFGFEF